MDRLQGGKEHLNFHLQVSNFRLQFNPPFISRPDWDFSIGEQNYTFLRSSDFIAWRRPANMALAILDCGNWSLQ